MGFLVLPGARISWLKGFPRVHVSLRYLPLRLRRLQPHPAEAVLAVTRRGMLGGEANCSPSCAPTVHLGRRAHSRRPCCGIVCRSAQRVKVRQPDSPLQHTDFGGPSSPSWPLWRCKLDGLCRFVLPVQRLTAWLHSKTTDAPRQGLNPRLATWLRTSFSIQEFGGGCGQHNSADRRSLQTNGFWKNTGQ